MGVPRGVPLDNCGQKIDKFGCRIQPRVSCGLTAGYAYIRPAFAAENRVDVWRGYVKSLRKLPAEGPFFSVLKEFVLYCLPLGQNLSHFFGCKFRTPVPRPTVSCVVATRSRYEMLRFHTSFVVAEMSSLIATIGIIETLSEGADIPMKKIPPCIT